MLLPAWKEEGRDTLVTSPTSEALRISCPSHPPPYSQAGLCFSQSLWQPTYSTCLPFPSHISLEGISYHCAFS